MRLTLKALMAGVVLGLISPWFTGLTVAEDAKGTPDPAAIAKAMAEASAVGPEHEKLKPLTGSWTYTSKFWMDPSQPPIEGHGTTERKMILGGRFLEEQCRGTGFDGKPGMEVFGLIGYDNSQKKYTSTWVSSMCTGTCSGSGTSDAPGKFSFVNEAYCPIQKKHVKMRDELRFESADKTVATSYQVVDGKDVKMMEIVAVRKK